MNFMEAAKRCLINEEEYKRTGVNSKSDVGMRNNGSHHLEFFIINTRETCNVQSICDHDLYSDWTLIEPEPEVKLIPIIIVDDKGFNFSIAPPGSPSGRYIHESAIDDVLVELTGNNSLSGKNNTLAIIRERLGL